MHAEAPRAPCAAHAAHVGAGEGHGPGKVFLERYNILAAHGKHMPLKMVRNGDEWTSTCITKVFYASDTRLRAFTGLN